jgi:hypothetical protein
MVIRLNMETWVIGKVGIKSGGGKGHGWVEEELWVLLGFVSLMCIWVYFYCCSGRCLCYGLQGYGVYTIGTVI